MTYSRSFRIGERTISADSPTYFIADIAANHDGSLERAKELIWLAKEAGADVAKFQHFLADKIVSEVGFSKGVGSPGPTWLDGVARCGSMVAPRASA